MAVLILARRPNGDQLTYAGGVFYWIEGSTGISRELSQALTQANRFPTVAGWVTAIVPLVILGTQAFYSSAVRGCGARDVNSILTLLTAASAVFNVPAMINLTFKVLSCLAKGLAAQAGSLIVAHSEQDSNDLFFSFHDPRGTALDTPASNPVMPQYSNLIQAADGGYLLASKNSLQPGPTWVFDARFTVVATLQEIIGIAAATNHTDGFYVLDESRTLYRINLAGQVVDDWAIPETFLHVSMAMSPDNVTLYGHETGHDDVTKHVLGGASSPFASLADHDVALGTSASIITLPTGDVIIAWESDEFDGGNVVRRYDASGTLQRTYAGYAYPRTIKGLAPGLDETSFWWSWVAENPNNTVIVEEIQASDGLVLNRFSETDINAWQAVSIAVAHQAIL